MRAMNLANALANAGHKVVLWSSAFYHQEKSHRARASTAIRISAHIEIRLIPSPGYVRNIGPARLWDHAVLGYRLAQELGHEEAPPDVAFIGYPPIEAAAVMTRWLSKRGVPCLLDVKDQWPTIFTRALPAPIRALGEVALWPYFYLGRRAMRDASGIVAMAEEFLQWALAFSGRTRSEKDRVTPLTTTDARVSEADLQNARRWWDGLGVPADGRARVCFIGSHSQAFDMNAVATSVSQLAALGQACEFVFCGDGESSAQWRRLMSGADNVIFPGWVDRPQIEALAERSMASLAPYHNTEDFAMSIPNKVIDALALGLPVLCPLEGEVQRLITSHGVGLCYGTAAGASLSECLVRLLEDRALRLELSTNASRLYREQFSFEMVYGGLVTHLEKLAQASKLAVRHG
ncbi:MAG TPA: glycosyltransferase [Burkholderiaceae bacterium]|nr:glycosyltransferase [Burkholderiaceae bacterium]